jgi:hypothetical protein
MLLSYIVGLAQGMTKGNLDGQRPRRPHLFRPEGHIGHHDGRQPCGL